MSKSVRELLTELLLRWPFRSGGQRLVGSLGLPCADMNHVIACKEYSVSACQVVRSAAEIAPREGIGFGRGKKKRGSIQAQVYNSSNVIFCISEAWQSFFFRWLRFCLACQTIMQWIQTDVPSGFVMKFCTDLKMITTSPEKLSGLVWVGIILAL